MHLNPTPWTDGKHYTTMTQCTATPADPSDPTLAKWKKRTIISSKQIPKGVSQHFHDDSEAFKGADGRWWMFMGSKWCPGTQKATGDCPYPDPSVTHGGGANYLFSSSDFKSWRPEHSLYASDLKSRFWGTILKSATTHMKQRGFKMVPQNLGVRSDAFFMH